MKDFPKMKLQVLNVCNFLFLSCLMCLCNIRVSYSQSINKLNEKKVQNLSEKKYCLETNKGEIISRSCITFLDENTFVYRGGLICNDLGEDYGMGNYTINNNLVSLDFNLTDVSYRSFHNTERIDHKKDSVSINVNVKDDAKIPLAYGFITLTSLKDSPSKSTDSTGFVSFRIKRSKIPVKVESSYAGYKTYNFYIVPDADYNLEIIQDYSIKCNFRNEIWNCKIISKQNKEYLIVKKHKYSSKHWGKFRLVNDTN